MTVNRKPKEAVTVKTLVFMLKTAWKNKPSLFFLYLLLLIVSVTRNMLLIVLPKFLIDGLLAAVNHTAVEEHLATAVFFALLTVLSTLTANILTSFAEQWKSVQTEWFHEYFETELASHSMKMDFEHTEDPDALNQLHKAKEGISWYSGGVVGILDHFYNIITNVGVLFGVLAVILITCPLLLPVQIIALVFITIFNAKNNRLEVSNFQRLAKSNRLFSYFFFQLSEFSLGKDIRLYDSVDMMYKKAEGYSAEQVGFWRDTQRSKQKNCWFIDVMNSLRDGISYFYIGFLALTKAITIGDFSMCAAAASSLYWSLAGIVSGFQEITKRCSYAYQFLKFLDYPAAMPKGTKTVAGKEHTIEFSHVSFKYPRSDTFVLQDITLTIKAGEHLSIVGLNGAGKTTFIKLLCRLYDVTDGEILIDGINIKEYSEEEYRRLFAVVFQDFQLFAFSLRDNISLGAPEDDAEIKQVLELSGFYEDALKLEKGLDTVLYKSFDEDGTELSGGQKQKTAISRALYKNAPIVILDEPTAALDPVAEYDIYRKFNSLVGGKTAIYISHRLSSCKFCDKIAVFVNDTIGEYGSHEELVSLKNGIYAEMFAAQAQYYIEKAKG